MHESTVNSERFIRSVVAKLEGTDNLDSNSVAESAANSNTGGLLPTISDYNLITLSCANECAYRATFCRIALLWR